MNTDPADIILQAHILHLNNLTQSHTIGSTNRGKAFMDRLLYFRADQYALCICILCGCCVHNYEVYLIYCLNINMNLDVVSNGPSEVSSPAEAT